MGDAREGGTVTTPMALLTEHDDGRTLIEFPSCPGCQTFAEADEDVGAVAREALEGWIEAHQVAGHSVPAVDAGAIKVFKVQVAWSAEDKAFIARVPELPGCMADGPTEDEARIATHEAIRVWLETDRERTAP